MLNPNRNPKRTLPNQALEIARKPKGDGKDAEVVLCLLPGNDVTPFVTWVQSKHDDGCYWGHYCVNYDEANDDYVARR